MFLLGIILLPFVFIGLPLVLGIGYGIFGCFYIIVAACKMYIGSIMECALKIFLIFLSFPGGILAIGICTAGGAFVSAIGAILIIPALFFHVYVYTRSVIWWNKNRVKE